MYSWWCRSLESDSISHLRRLFLPLRQRICNEFLVVTLDCRHHRLKFSSDLCQCLIVELYLLGNNRLYGSHFTTGAMIFPFLQTGFGTDLWTLVDLNSVVS